MFGFFSSIKTGEFDPLYRAGVLQEEMISIYPAII